MPFHFNPASAAWSSFVVGLTAPLVLHQELRVPLRYSCRNARPRPHHKQTGSLKLTAGRSKRVSIGRGISSRVTTRPGWPRFASAEGAGARPASMDGAGIRRRGGRAIASRATCPAPSRAGYRREGRPSIVARMAVGRRFPQAARKDFRVARRGVESLVNGNA